MGGDTEFGLMNCDSDNAGVIYQVTTLPLCVASQYVRFVKWDKAFPTFSINYLKRYTYTLQCNLIISYTLYLLMDIEYQNKKFNQKIERCSLILPLLYLVFVFFFIFSSCFFFNASRRTMQMYWYEIEYKALKILYVFDVVSHNVNIIMCQFK